MRCKITFILILTIIRIKSQNYNYYVSTNGSDFSGDGSITMPFKSISKAQKHIRNNKPVPMTQDIIVHIEGGAYNLDSTLQFNNLDSGNNGYFVIYQGLPTNKPILSSGKNIMGWTKVDNTNIYKTNIGDLYSRQVYIGGVKAIRARSDGNLGLIETSKGYFSSCTDFSNWTNIKDIELISNMHWRSRRIPIESICNSQIFIHPHIWDHFTHNTEMRFTTAPVNWVENAYELLDQPDEWYIDKLTNLGNNTLYLVSNTLPTDIIIPTLESLIFADGVENVKFSNLGFHYSLWNEASYINNSLSYNNWTSNHGFSNEQSDYYKSVNGDQKLIPSAVKFINARNVYFNNNEFKNMGATALSFEEGSANNTICGNEFENIAASAIRLGTISYNSVDLILGNKIINNTIHNVANEYFGSVGVFVPYARNTTIENNTLSNFPYSGISVGWGWDITKNVGINSIKYNKIDCTNQFIPDGGAIYTLSAHGDPNNKTQIIGNYILNQRVYQGGIYMDNYSSYINVAGNVIDKNNSLVFPLPNQMFCINNDVMSIVVYSGSKHVNITDNYYYKNGNLGYLDPPSGNHCSPPCEFINVLNNTVFVNHNSIINNIINSAGVQSSINCN